MAAITLSGIEEGILPKETIPTAPGIRWRLGGLNCSLAESSTKSHAPPFDIFANINPKWPYDATIELYHLSVKFYAVLTSQAYPDSLFCQNWSHWNLQNVSCLANVAQIEIIVIKIFELVVTAQPNVDCSRLATSLFSHLSDEAFIGHVKARRQLLNSADRVFRQTFSIPWLQRVSCLRNTVPIPKLTY